ncbi:MAG TPA: hypothetical protein VN048_16780, partial [Verrucomicrobiae bacterium]|nr:hypothetical protein [Verrucomicrobiae bacterium]
LGIGLHSYGFTAAAFRWLTMFIASQLLLVLLGCLPKHMWRSFSQTAPATPTVPPAKGVAPAAVNP